jgi:hypothetical protein
LDRLENIAGWSFCTRFLIKGEYKTKINEDTQKEKLFAQIVAEPKKEPEEDTGEIDVRVFYSAIEKIEKIRPSNAKTGAEWKFTFKVDGKTAIFQLANNQIMHNPMVFEDLFKSNFGMYLPGKLTRKPEKGEVSPWKKFMRYIEQVCEEVDPVESIEWIECDILLERIAGFKMIIDGTVWINKTRSKNTLLKKTQGNSTYFLLKPEDIQQLAKDLKIGSTVETLGRVMNTRGLKRSGNPAVRIDKKNVLTAWWFTEECLLERGLVLDPLQNSVKSEPPLTAEGGY